VTIDGHLKGSERSHNQVEGNAKVVGIKEMSGEEFGREMIELKVHISVPMELLQKYEEDHRYG